MAEENTNNKIALYRVPDAGLKPRRTPFAAPKFGELEKTPDLAVYWKVIIEYRII